MVRILTALVVVMAVAFVGATLSFVTGNNTSAVLMLVAGLLASLAIPIAVAISVVRRAHAAVTRLGAGHRHSATLPRTFDPDVAATAERPPSTWLPSPSTKTITTTTTTSTTTTSGDVDPATAEALVRSVSGMGLDELVRRATAGEPIPGADDDVTRREFTLVGPGPDAGQHDRPTVDVADSPASLDGSQQRSVIATVNGVRDTGVDGTVGRMFELDLLVGSSGGTPSRVVTVHDLSPTSVPRLGQTIWVRVDPARPGHVEIA